MRTSWEATLVGLILVTTMAPGASAVCGVTGCTTAAWDATVSVWKSGWDAGESTSDAAWSGGVCAYSASWNAHPESAADCALDASSRVVDAATLFGSEALNAVLVFLFAVLD